MNILNKSQLQRVIQSHFRTLGEEILLNGRPILVVWDYYKRKFKFYGKQKIKIGDIITYNGNHQIVDQVIQTSIGITEVRTNIYFKSPRK